jgi:hypothetical protein
MENMGRGNTEPRGLSLEYCPDCHLAQISLRRGAGEHVLHCDGRLRRACHNQGLSKNAQLQAILSTTAAFVLYIL